MPPPEESGEDEKLFGFSLNRTQMQTPSGRQVLDEFRQFRTKLSGESLKQQRLLITQHLFINKTETFALVYGLKRSQVTFLSVVRVLIKKRRAQSPNLGARLQHTPLTALFHSAAVKHHAARLSHILHLFVPLN